MTDTSFSCAPPGKKLGGGFVFRRRCRWPSSRTFGGLRNQADVVTVEIAAIVAGDFALEVIPLAGPDLQPSSDRFGTCVRKSSDQISVDPDLEHARALNEKDSAAVKKGIEPPEEMRPALNPAWRVCDCARNPLRFKGCFGWVCEPNCLEVLASRPCAGMTKRAWAGMTPMQPISRRRPRPPCAAECRRTGRKPTPTAPGTGACTRPRSRAPAS